MRKLIVVLILATTASALSSYINVINEEWQTFKSKHNKYYNSTAEDGFRLSLYLNSKVNVAEHNQRYYEGKESYLIETNVFSDMLPHEKSRRKGYVPPSRSDLEKGATFIRPAEEVVIPDSIDWREKGGVTPIKDQGNCGSCWAFAATGSLEGAHFRKTGKLVSLSEQNLLDCVSPRENCENGGSPMDAFKYIKNNGGIDTEESYPYTAKDGVCKFKRENVGATDKGFTWVPHTTPQALMEALAIQGPVIVPISTPDTFMAYKSGVYDDIHCMPFGMDHAVVAVGYGTTEEGVDYWIIKNSWGKSWGMDGYMLLLRSVMGICGVLEGGFYPLV